jgi:hypothetical protein
MDTNSSPHASGRYAAMPARSFVFALLLLLCATAPDWAAEPAGAPVVMQLQLPPSVSPEAGGDAGVEELRVAALASPLQSASGASSMSRFRLCRTSPLDPKVWGLRWTRSASVKQAESLSRRRSDV